MLGAMIGDIVGSPYEFDCNNIKTKNFPLLSKQSRFTDDTVMTAAVAKGLMNGGHNAEKTRAEIIRSLRYWGARYPNIGYGQRFQYWLWSDDPQPYGSYGNGSAMRVSAVGWLYSSLDDVLRYAKISAEVTHDHPEGIKGAQATAAAIFLTRTGCEKAELRRYIESTFHYDLQRTCDQIRPTYHHEASCQQTVPEAITAFLEGVDFEDVVRTAVSLGGDCDTLTAIAASIAEAVYPIPNALRQDCLSLLPEDLQAVFLKSESFTFEQ